MNQRTFYKSIDKLIELGFVKVIRNGYAAKICNIYGFSDMWKVYGTKGFEVKEEFKRLSKQKYKLKLAVRILLITVKVLYSNNEIGFLENLNVVIIQ